MTFEYLHPLFLIFTLALFAFGVFFIISLSRFQERKVSILFLLFAYGFLMISLLWPRGWLTSSVATSLWSNIAFVVDVSKSMNALDFTDGQISRLWAAKILISDFVNDAPENNYALDVFSGDGVKILPFTSDTSIYQTFLSGIDESSVSVYGTDIKKALLTTTSHFIEDIQGWVIVVLTDGWDEKIWDVSDLRELLEEKNILLIIAGIWSPKGNYIPTWVDFFWRINYKVYDGQKVVTKMNESWLKSISDALWWKYVSIIWESDVDRFYKTISDTSEKVVLEKNINERRNLAWLFLCIAFVFWVLFLWNLCVSKLWRKK